MLPVAMVTWSLMSASSGSVAAEILSFEGPTTDRRPPSLGRLQEEGTIMADLGIVVHRIETEPPKLSHPLGSQLVSGDNGVVHSGAVSVDSALVGFEAAVSCGLKKSLLSAVL